MFSCIPIRCILTGKEVAAAMLREFLGQAEDGSMDIDFIERMVKLYLL